MLNIKKDMATLMELAMQRADSVTLPYGTTISLTPGSVSRLLIACINAEFEMAYDKLEEVHLQSFLSTASGEYLDLLGDIVSCGRRVDETDDNFRYRISKQVTILESSNELSIRMALLAIDGIADIILKPFTYGCGSFTAFVITENATDQKEVVKACEKVLSDTVGYGIKYNVEIPELIPIEVGIKIIFKSTAASQGDTRAAIKASIREYINSRKIGEDIVINEIIEKCMNASEDVYDVNFYKLYVNGSPVTIANQPCRSNERFIESSVPNAIYIV